MTNVLTVALEVPDCTVLGCMDPWELQGDQVVQEGHVGQDLHVVQEDMWATHGSNRPL